jgi:hypothetical protein
MGPRQPRRSRLRDPSRWGGKYRFCCQSREFRGSRREEVSSHFTNGGKSNSGGWLHMLWYPTPSTPLPWRFQQWPTSSRWAGCPHPFWQHLFQQRCTPCPCGFSACSLRCQWWLTFNGSCIHAHKQCQLGPPSDSRLANTSTT